MMRKILIFLSENGSRLGQNDLMVLIRGQGCG